MALKDLQKAYIRLMEKKWKLRQEIDLNINPRLDLLWQDIHNDPSFNMFEWNRMINKLNNKLRR